VTRWITAWLLFAAPLATAQTIPALAIPIPLADPLPMRRVELPPLATGTFVVQNRSEFEALVRAAALASQAAPPRILSAHYEAALSGTDLRGNGEWAVGGRGAIPLDPLNVALDEPQWPGGAPAVLERTATQTRAASIRIE